MQNSSATGTGHELAGNKMYFAFLGRQIYWSYRKIMRTIGHPHAMYCVRLSDLINNSLKPAFSAVTLNSETTMDSKLLPRIGVIGTGVIAEALLIGMIEHSRCSGPIRVSLRNEQRSARLAERFGNVVVERSNQAIIDQADLIIFAVLPDQAAAVLNDLTFREDQTLINIVAGFPVAEIRKIVSPLSRVHRLIPLPPVEFGLGPLPLFPPCENIANLFSGCGQVIQVDDESAFTSFTAASGLMATHHRLTATVAKWVASRGVTAENAAAYTGHMFHALTHLESTASSEDLQGLARECVTKGGLNELALDQLEELQWFDQLVKRLDSIEERLEKIVGATTPDS